VKRVLLLAVFLAGCAPLEWTHPDATPEQVQLDAEDCQQRAWREAQWRSFGYLSYGRGRWRDPYWSDRYYDETRLSRFCMEVRGYTLQAAPRD
jgi:hypothetical protein